MKLSDEFPIGFKYKKKHFYEKTCKDTSNSTNILTSKSHSRLSKNSIEYKMGLRWISLVYVWANSE